MKIVWSKTAEKQFSKIDTRYQNRIKFRLRLGDYRVIYTFGDPQGDTCYVVAVKRRTTTTYLHEEHTEYDYSVHQG